MAERAETFHIAIESFRNYTWQGVLRYFDDDYPFSSEMELLLIMDRIVKKKSGEENRTDERVFEHFK